MTDLAAPALFAARCAACGGRLEVITRYDHSHADGHVVVMACQSAHLTRDGGAMDAACRWVLETYVDRCIDTHRKLCAAILAGHRPAPPL